MSAELFDGESAGALALPAVDILPAKPTRKPKGPAEDPPAAPPLLEASPQGWTLPAPHAPVNPWTGAPADPAVAAYPPPTDAQAPGQVPGFGYEQAQLPHSVPVPADQMPPPSVDVGNPGLLAELPPAAPAEADSAPKKFLGMQVRRQKKTAPPPDAPAEVTPPPFEAGLHEAAPSAYEAAVAPVAPWPTDLDSADLSSPNLSSPNLSAPDSSAPGDGTAEPAQGPGGHAAPAAFAPMAVTATDPAEPAPVQAPVQADGPAPVPTPVPQEPAVALVDQAELASLRAQVGVSESQRLAAENRADQAVSYAQQTQARLGQLEVDGQARIQAAETKARSAANEAQDWQIRHREAEATIAELAASLAGAEKRMAELRVERDDLASALDVATAPEQPAPTT